jgi:hypothetical protein
MLSENVVVFSAAGYAFAAKTGAPVFVVLDAP